MKLQHSIEIARPCAAVFAYLTSHEHMPKWISTLETSTQSSPGGLARDSEFLQEHVERGKRIRFSGKVTEYTEPVSLTLELSNDDALVTLTYRCQERPTGTLLEQTSEVKLHNMMLRMVAGAFEGTVRDRMKTDFETLKAQLEAGA